MGCSETEISEWIVEGGTVVGSQQSGCCTHSITVLFNQSGVTNGIVKARGTCYSSTQGYPFEVSMNVQISCPDIENYYAELDESDPNRRVIKFRGNFLNGKYYLIQISYFDANDNSFVIQSSYSGDITCDEAFELLVQNHRVVAVCTYKYDAFQLLVPNYCQNF